MGDSEDLIERIEIAKKEDRNDSNNLGMSLYLLRLINRNIFTKPNRFDRFMKSLEEVSRFEYCELVHHPFANNRDCFGVKHPEHKTIIYRPKDQAPLIEESFNNFLENVKKDVPMVKRSDLKYYKRSHVN